MNVDGNATKSEETESEEVESDDGGPFVAKRNRTEMRALGRRNTAGTGGRQSRKASAALRAGVRSIWNPKPDEFNAWRE